MISHKVAHYSGKNGAKSKVPRGGRHAAKIRRKGFESTNFFPKRAIAHRRRRLGARRVYNASVATRLERQPGLWTGEQFWVPLLGDQQIVDAFVAFVVN